MTKIGLNIYSELFSLLCAIFCYKKLRGSYVQWFIPFLAITFFTEAFANIRHQKGLSTLLIYDIFNPFTVIFYTYILSKITITKNQKKILIATTSTYLVLVLLYHLFFKSIIESHYLIIASGIEITFFSCMIFYQYLKSDDLDSIPNYRSNLLIVAGLLIFYSGIAIVLSLLHYIRNNNLKIGNQYLYNFVPRYLCIILYGCFSASFFIWKKPVQK